MKKSYLLLLLLLLSSIVHGQNVNTYVFTQSTTTYTPITGTAAIAAGWDDGSSGLITIPFTFTYHGTPYTSCYIQSNGFVAFGSVGSTYTVISSTTGSGGVVAGMSRDIQDGSSNPIIYNTIGTAPNRIFVVQWTNCKKYGTGGTGDSYNFQIRLYETTNAIQVVYGSCVNGATSNTIQVGLRNTSNADYNNRTTTSDWSATTAGTANNATCTISSTVVPANGLTFTWNPPSACTGMPTAGSITPGSSAYCASTSQTLSLTGNTQGTGITYYWEQSTNGGSTWTAAGSTTTSLSTGTITQTTMYRATVACTNSGLSQTTSPITLTINPNPTITSVTPNPSYTCSSGASTNLTVSGTGTSYSWSPGTGLNTTTGTTVVASPTSTTTYTATATLGSCSVGLPITVIVATPPALTTTATPSAICSGDTTQLATSLAPTTSYTVTSITHAPVTQTSPQTPTFTSNDDGYATVNMPFTFSFYNNTYTTSDNIYIGTNGYVGFSSTSMTSLSAQNLPSTTNPSNLIAMFWHDLNLNNGGTITYSTEGTAPNRKFVIYFNDVKDYSNSTSSNNNGQIILYETTNIIEVHVAYTNNTATTYTRTLGIENSGGTAAVTPAGRNYTTWTVTSTPEAWRFSPPQYVYDWSPGTNLDDSTIYNPIASNNTAPTTFSVLVTDQITGCSSTGTVSTTINPLPSASFTVTSPLCDGQTATVTFTGTADGDIVFSEDGVSQAISLNSSGTAIYTSQALSSNTVYTLDTITGTLGCKTIVNAIDTAIVNIRPTASISGTQTICEGQTAYLMVNMGQGTAPYTITYSDGTNSYSQTNSFTSFAIPVTPSATTTYVITDVIDSNCVALPGDITGSATVTVNPRPTAALSLSATTVCDATSADLVVTLTGNAPYNFDIYDGTQYTSYTNIMTSPYVISVNPGTTTSYEITALTDANCVGWMGMDYGGPVTLNVNPRPTSVISGTDVVCNGTSSDLNVDLTGNAPWSFNYFDGTSTVNVSNIMSTPYTLTLTPNTTATYIIVALTDANCSALGNDMTGSGSITVNYPPAILSQSTDITRCAGDAVSFSVNATGTNLFFQWTENGNALNDAGVYSGTNTASLDISDITGLDNNVYELQISGTCPPSIVSAPMTLHENINNNWTGAVNTLWSNTGNWSCGILPTAATHVLVPTSVPNMPDVDIPTAICNSLFIYQGANVEIIGTGNALELKSNVVNLGTFNANAGSVILSGNGTQNIPGGNYDELHIFGGSTKTFSGNVVIANELELQSGIILLGLNNLVVGPDMTVTGGNQFSYVQTDSTGMVVSQDMGAGYNTNPVLFPVGINGSYTPVTVANIGDVDQFGVRLIDNVYTEYNGDVPNGPQILNNVVGKTWLISEGTDGGSNATITPQWNAVNELNTFDRNNCVVSHYNVDSNKWEPGPMSAAAGSGPYTQTMTGVTSFSPFGVGSTASPLGIDLVSFTGVQMGNNVQLDWLTLNEFNVAVYEVERSLDKGRTFEYIGKKSPVGNNLGGQFDYKFTDISVRGLGVDKLYYRLKIKDRNGMYKYSNVINVKIEDKIADGETSLYPNPVTGKEVFIRLSEQISGNFSVQVTDISGRVLSTVEYKGGQYDAKAVRVDVANLVPGIYLLRIADAANTTLETLKFNKQ